MKILLQAVDQVLIKSKPSSVASTIIFNSTIVVKVAQGNLLANFKVKLVLQDSC